MKTPIRILTVLALVLSFIVSASAQTTTTGAIEGTVADVNGAAIPGVAVSVAGPNLQGVKTATTNDEGFFNLPQIPPGRYTITIEAAKGFGRFEQANIEVNLTKTSSLAVTLRPAGATEVVEVTASSGAAVDVSTNTTGTNVSTEQFSNFPTQRTVQSLYSIAPTVTRSGLRDASGRERDPSVAGSSGPENNYILDGVSVTDPAFGGSGANLPFEFVQEVQVLTGAYGADIGKSTGGVFNVITKSGSNEIRGDIFGYFTAKSFVRETTNFAYTGAANNGFNEVDAGFDIGGPIVKDKLWFFGAFNPQRRENSFLTQTFRQEVENKITTPFYAGKITYGPSINHTLTVSTFGDFTKQQGFLFGNSGFGADQNSFRGEIQTGGHNYAARLNSTFSPSFIGEFSGGLHFQRANTLPDGSVAGTALVTDNFAILRNGTVAGVTTTNINDIRQIDHDDNAATATVPLDFGNVFFVNAPGGSLQRNFIQQGFGLFSNQDRNRYEAAARFQNIWGKHTLKYGFEFNRNMYNIDQRSTGPDQTFSLVNQGRTLTSATDGTDNSVNGFRVTNNFSVCTTRGTQIVCPNATAASRAALIAAAAGYTGATQASITAAEALNNPFLVGLSTRVRDFQLVADTATNIESFYLQDDFKVSRNFQLNLGVRWDYQQAYGNEGVRYLALNDFIANLQPRLGFIWDFTGEGRGKVFANFARFIETPIPLDVNVRAGSENSQTDKNFNVNRYAAPSGAFIVPGLNGSTGSAAITATSNLGSHPTPIDVGLSPQSVDEYTAGIEYEIVKDLALGVRGIYRAQDNVIEDGSFDDGNNYFLFNPGRRVGQNVTTEDLACNDAAIGCFGPARRYYRALEFTATKRFTNNYQFIASYVYSSLIGNYEGLFRNDNGQSDPNITSLFDLVSLLSGTYGRLPNDRPHQFKFDGSYRWNFGLLTSASFRVQSGIPFNALIPHPVYGNNEGFGAPRGTAIVPSVANQDPNFPNVVQSVGDSRTPRTYQLDLGAYYPIQLGENRQLRFQADWFNVTNQQRAITLDQTLRINSGVTGVAPVDNPFFGSGLIFQFPSALRLGVKFQF